MKKSVLFFLLTVVVSLLFSVAAVSAQCYGNNCCYNNCCNNNCIPYYNYSTPANCAVFVSDVTYADGTYVAPGSSFVKTWRVRNNGTSTWNSNYKLVFYSGNQLSAPYSVNLPYNVAPGQTVDISVPMVAPASSGTFKGSWMLQTDGGVNFGVGAACNTAVWVEITTQQYIPPSYGPCLPPCRPNPFPPAPAPKPGPIPPAPKPGPIPGPQPWWGSRDWYPVR